MSAKKTANREPGFPTVKHTFTKLQRTTCEDSRGLVTTATIVLESRLVAHLCVQHSIDCFDFAICDVMVMHELAEILNMVPTLQLAIGNTQELAGKLSGMAMTIITTVIPHSVKINTSSFNRWCQQHSRKP